MTPGAARSAPQRPAPADGCSADGDSLVVLGIGNVLWADEGFGVRAVEALGARWQFAPQVRLVDGGTQGLYLLPLVQSATRLLILDAVDYGLPPGTLERVDNDDVPRFLGARKMSLHQTGFQEVLMLAQMTASFPREVVLIGCQPEELDDYGGSLRPSVKAALEVALDQAVACIAAWGGAPLRREAAAAAGDSVHAPSLAIDAYESGRPSAQAACRIGDARFIAAAASE
ncbi:MAG: HyaD/HybD family hydrogenase maturation endopeptidase [Burkholderiaceae bacterium]